MSIAEPSTAALRSLAGQLVSDALVIFPVRHHSPACALHVLRAFAELRPSLVLVEGPRSFTELIAQLTHADAKAPLAIYTYAVQKVDADNERRMAAYYPFCDYSPELVALREARRLGITARFIDLEFTEQCLIGAEAESDEASTLLDESHYAHSHYLKALAAQYHCRDHDELWEHLFETHAADLDLRTHIAHIAAYCALARQDSSPAALSAEGSLQREAEMAWHIQAALAQREAHAGPILAVMGGFHAVAMPALLAQPVVRPKAPRANISDAASALIRYSFERLDRLHGYGAGMTSPAWHQRLWERQLKYEKITAGSITRLRQEVALTTLFDIAQTLRERHGLPLPMPTLAAAYEQALRLAALRGRPAPVRDDVMDAVVSCFIKGDADADGAMVQAAARRVLTGQHIGAVPKGTGSPPLVKDFEMRARRQRLKLDEVAQRKLMLDIYRRPEHRISSRLLHGLALLNVPFGIRLAGPDFVNGLGLTRLQEHWEYHYSTLSEAALVEASVYGVTLPLAVANRFIAKLDRLQAEGEGRDARAAAAAMVQACVLGLHDHLPRVLDMLRIAIGEDADLVAVTEATLRIALLWESREPLEARGVEALPRLLDTAYLRAIFLGMDTQGKYGDITQVVQACTQLRELLGSSAGRALDASLYWNMLQTLLLMHPDAMLRGASAGLLYTAGHLDDASLAGAVHGHLNGMLDARSAVAFVRGLFQTAREVAWQQAGVLTVLDSLLATWGEADFTSNLPELRLAFAAMTPKETDRIAEALARLHGETELGRLVSHALSEAQLQANLALSLRVSDTLAEDGLSAWGLA